MIATDALAQLRACGVTIAAGSEPGTVRLTLRGPLPAALRTAIRDRNALREALDQEAADVAARAQRLRAARAVLLRATHLLTDPTPERRETRRGRRRAARVVRLSVDPSRALYWALDEKVPATETASAVLVTELVHAAVRRELEERCPGQPVPGGLLRLAASDSGEALRQLFLGAANRLRPPATAS